MQWLFSCHKATISILDAISARFFSGLPADFEDTQMAFALLDLGCKFISSTVNDIILKKSVRNGLLVCLTNMQKLYYVYILTNHPRHTVLYIGITNNLVTRGWQHKHKLFEGFTRKYNVDKLVYYEEYNDVYRAIAREKQLKG